MGLKNYVIKKIAIREGKKMLEKLKGNRTYIVNGTNFIMGVWLAAHQAGVEGVPEVPGVLIAILAGLGIYTRSLAKK